MVTATLETYYTAYHYKRQVHWGTKRKHVGNVIKQLVHRVYKRNAENGLVREDPLQRKDAAKRHMLGCVQFGVVGLYVQQRDCDHYWFEHVQLCKPVFTAVQRLIEQYHNDAEGPCYCRVLSPREAAAIRLGMKETRY